MAAPLRILVTGGAGFIGSHLCDSLVGMGHNVVALDNMRLGRLSNLAQIAAHPEFHCHTGDVNDQALLNELFQRHRFDTVFHMAANSDISVSHHTPDVDLYNTFQTTYSVLEAMRKHGCRNMVFASTSAIYGEAPGQVPESHGPLTPISHYGAAKLASEAFISSYVENYGMKAWMTRFPNVVGPRSTHGVIFDFVNKLRSNPAELTVLGDGSQEKPYLYVADLVEAMLYVWQHTDLPRNIYNVGVSSRTRVARIAEIVIEEAGLSSRIVFSGGSRGWIGDVPKFDYDISAITGIGWKARCSSDDAVRLAARHILGEVA